MLRNETDIAVVGADIGGCIAALALAPYYSVTLIDIQESSPPRVGESLPFGAKRIFSKLGLTELLQEQYVTSHGLVSFWGADQQLSLEEQTNVDGMGWHVNRQSLEQALRNTAGERGVDCLWPCTLKSSRQEGEQWLLNLSSQDEFQVEQETSLKAKVVIDATGRQSTFARQQGARRQQLDRLVSVWMTYCSPVKQQLSSIHPTTNGWWYSAPIPQLPMGCEIQSLHHKNKRPRLLSYQTDSDLLDKSLINSADALLDAAKKIPALSEMLEQVDLDTVTNHGLVASNSSRLINQEGNNWFAIGDAAMSFDPLSSQGMFNAMASAMQLSDLIVKFGIDSEVGKTTIAFEFHQQLERIWEQYEMHNQYYYAQERRWIKEAFWERRAA